jgi:hypothetical protein
MFSSRVPSFCGDDGQVQCPILNLWQRRSLEIAIPLRTLHRAVIGHERNMIGEAARRTRSQKSRREIDDCWERTAIERHASTAEHSEGEKAASEDTANSSVIISIGLDSSSSSFSPRPFVVSALESSTARDRSSPTVNRPPINQFSHDSRGVSRQAK